MKRLATISTFVGLFGLLLAMLAALGSFVGTLIALGFVLMILGATGALLGAAASLARAGHSAR